MNEIAIDLGGYPVITAFLIVMAAILLDALLGIILAIVKGEFVLRLMPQFLATNVFPYMGGLLIFAAAAYFLPEPYSAVFYVVAGAALVKYLAEMWSKVGRLFGNS